MGLAFMLSGYSIRHVGIEGSLLVVQIILFYWGNALVHPVLLELLVLFEHAIVMGSMR